MLESLRSIALIQSTEASDRIDGVVAPPRRIRELVEHKTTPRNRSEGEIAGCRGVLATIRGDASNTVLTPQIINDIVESLPDGSSCARFKPAPAVLTPGAIEHLV
ncbi:MAG: hypothetical protein WCP98_16830 [Actinomycetes bacterium]